MERINPAREDLRWLQGGAGSSWSGFDVRGWPNALWLLHGMFVDAEPGHKRRLMWSELAARAGRVPPTHVEDFPQAQRWGFDPYDNQFSEPVHEGSLDNDSWDGLLDALQHAACTECVVFFCEMYADDLDGGGDFWAGDVSELASWVGRGDADGTPTNIWSRDRSWFVYTDADGLATYVGGNERVVQRLRDDDRTETVAARTPT